MKNVEVIPLTKGPNHHFFGYYGINPSDPTQVYHLCLETDFQDRPPGPDDRAKIGLVERSSGRFMPVGETKAFNFQQGSMLHWIDAGFGAEITFNDWEKDSLVSRAIGLASRNTRTLSAPIAAVSPSGTVAAGLNYARMWHCRPVVGYANNMGSSGIPPAPKDDGLFVVDLATGEKRLILSFEEIVKISRFEPDSEHPVWFNHVLFNTDGSRLLFFCRIKLNKGHDTSLWTVNPDGSDLNKCQIDFGHWTSHFAWRDKSHILVSSDVLGDRQFVILRDRGCSYSPAGKGQLPDDGHASFSPDGRWIVCDSYPREPEHLSELALFRYPSFEKVNLGGFFSDPLYRGDIRCDLHPRWSPDGNFVTFDSVHQGDRQIYMIDVEDIKKAILEPASLKSE